MLFSGLAQADAAQDAAKVFEQFGGKRVGVQTGTISGEVAQSVIPDIEANGIYTSLPQLDGKRIGVQTGTSFDEIVLGTLPGALISYYNSYPDMAAALEANKIDGFPGDEPVLRLMASEDSKLTILDEYMDSFEFGFVLPKTAQGDKLLVELNSWIESVRASGELDKLISKWTAASALASIRNAVRRQTF